MTSTYLLFSIPVLLFFCWLVSEFYGNRTLRIILGVITFSPITVFLFWGALFGLSDSNRVRVFSIRKLISITVGALKQGKSDLVIMNLINLDQQIDKSRSKGREWESLSQSVEEMEKVYLSTPNPAVQPTPPAGGAADR